MHIKAVIRKIELIVAPEISWKCLLLLYFLNFRMEYSDTNSFRIESFVRLISLYISFAFS